MNTRFEKYFPFSSIREEQNYVFEQLEQAYNNNKRYIIIEAGTGIGKSAIAKAISGYSKQSYLLTATKQLQDQYEKDFKRFNTKVIKGKANYQCSLDDRFNCQNGLCNYRTALKKQCGDNCLYASARGKALNAEMCVCSYAYFLGFVSSNEPQDIIRDTILIDEAHLIEDQLIHMASMTLNRKKLQETFNFFFDLPLRVQQIFKMPFSDKSNNAYEFYLNWIQTLHDILNNKYTQLYQELVSTSDTRNLGVDNIKDVNEIKKLTNTIDKLKSLIERLDYFLSTNKGNWIVNAEDSDTLKIQPLLVDKLFKNLINKHAQNKVIFLSATIINVNSFCNDLGINRNDIAYIRKDSIFDPFRSPIVDDSVGNMSYKCINNTMPFIYEEIKAILAKHKGQKGIIHTGNYSIMNNIINNVKSKRFIYREDRKNLTVSNEAMLKMHSEHKGDTVLVSPSLMTGVDLADDLSRFQIIVKMPYIALADKRVKYKMEIDKEWYNAKMLRNLVQACGRSTRSGNDWSVTYILDNSFYQIVQRFQACLPENFKRRIVLDSKFNLVKFYNYVKK